MGSSEEHISGEILEYIKNLILPNFIYRQIYITTVRGPLDYRIQISK